ncbi:MAG: hypothetical protein A2W61_01660 [Deltaproteobacteria bacterium RIFCSPLOWO2_01_44_7]|nr:MAG: hypothetical protein A2W61_01660 [Deltaproteobacteria bacterium RIFCSPLOWO2_01_44_7]
MCHGSQFGGGSCPSVFLWGPLTKPHNKHSGPPTTQAGYPESPNLSRILMGYKFFGWEATLGYSKTDNY